MMKKKQFAVVVSSHGEVDTPSIRAYYQNMKHIFAHVAEVMPLSKSAQKIIPLVGSVIQTIKTKREGFRSPMNQVSADQTERIAHVLRALQQEEFEFHVFNAYETTPPYTKEIIESLDRYEGIVVLTMNPIDSAFSCEALCRLGAKHFGQQAFQKFRVVNGLWKDDGLIRIYRHHIYNVLKNLNLNPIDSNGLIIAMHGTVTENANGHPVSFRNGAAENEVLFSLLHQGLMSDARNLFKEIRIAYLNHDVGGKWSEPTLSQTIEAMKQRHIQTVALFAAGYYADNSETVFSAKHQLEKAGFKAAHYIPCINDSIDFAALMADRIFKTAKGLSGRQALVKDL
jgi:protoporphyrin/coproporphyrin ferrochelatase